jgi:hypothetical protein
MSYWDDRPDPVEVFIRGMRRWLLFFGVFFLLVAGMQGVTNPHENTRWRIAGWIFLAVAIPIIIVTVGRWAKLLPVVFAYGGLEVGFISFGGYSATNLNPVSPFGYVLIYLILALCVTISIALCRKKHLSMVDRGCLLAAAALVAGQAARESLQSRQLGPPAGHYNEFVATFAGILALLLFAWTYDRLRR